MPMVSMMGMKENSENRTAGNRKMVDVLLIDDQSDCLRRLAEELRQYKRQFNVIAAVSTDKAYTFLKTIMVDVIVRDLSMEERDGVEKTRLLRDVYPGLRIVFLSPENAEKPLESTGSIQYIERSASSQELASAIYRA